MFKKLVDLVKEMYVGSYEMRCGPLLLWNIRTYPRWCRPSLGRIPALAWMGKIRSRDFLATPTEWSRNRCELRGLRRQARCFLEEGRKLQIFMIAVIRLTDIANVAMLNRITTTTVVRLMETNHCDDPWFGWDTKESNRRHSFRRSSSERRGTLLKCESQIPFRSRPGASSCCGAFSTDPNQQRTMWLLLT